MKSAIVKAIFIWPRFVEVVHCFLERIEDLLVIKSCHEPSISQQ